jgi:hypothetical protein
MAEEKFSQPITKDDMQDLLAQQSKIILGAVEEGMEKRIAIMGADLRKEIREVGVTVDAIQSDLKQVLEAVDIHTQQLERIEKQTEKIEPMQDDIEAIKVTTQNIQYELKGKADREELTALELKFRPA